MGEILLHKVKSSLCSGEIVECVVCVIWEVKNLLTYSIAFFYIFGLTSIVTLHTFLDISLNASFTFLKIYAILVTVSASKNNQQRRIDMETLSFIMSTIALALYSSSYFFNNKRNYLIFQLTGNVFLSFSYLFMGAYFTMVSVAIGIARGLICYTYEKKDKSVPRYLIFALCFVTVASYVVINYVVLSGEASPWDVLYLIASCMYAITFAMRNIKLMRYVILIPHVSAISYNLLVKAPISSAISYTIELVITIVAIIKFGIQEKRAVKKQYR
ncbi:MAG: YgjV family protein [Ruminococcaceae bacterium]|nr:YgjV family protein [Oscillospiraceae bacterium]